VATNMAGRGVDIVLGGRPDGRTPAEWQNEHDEVIQKGGLHIIGTERHEARRIDNQLRGRAGRQGDPGSTRFFVSLEDDIMRRFAATVSAKLWSGPALERTFRLKTRSSTKPSRVRKSESRAIISTSQTFGGIR